MIEPTWLNFWEYNDRFFLHHLYPCFGFWWCFRRYQSYGGFPCLHALLPVCNGFLRFTSGVTSATLLAASMVAKSFHTGAHTHKHWQVQDRVCRGLISLPKFSQDIVCWHLKFVHHISQRPMLKSKNWDHMLKYINPNSAVKQSKWVLFMKSSSNLDWLHIKDSRWLDDNDWVNPKDIQLQKVDSI